MLPLANIASRAPQIGRAPDDFFMAPYEREVLVLLIRDIAAKTVVEIGVQAGHAAHTLLKHVPTIERYIGVDVTPDYKPVHNIQKTEILPDPGYLVMSDPRFQLITRPRGSLDLTSLDLPPCDVMLIDGDHGRAPVEHDSSLAFSLVRPGGLIIWHDYDIETTTPQHDVVTVLQELRAQGRLIEHVPNTWLAILRT